MPKMNQMFPSKWLAAADLNDADATLTIKAVEEETVGQGDEAERKWVVYFNEVGKGLVLNKTNANSISSCLGDDTDDWIGRKVVLYPTQVQFSGKMVEAIRVKERATRNLFKPAAKPGTRTEPQPGYGNIHKAQPVTQAEADDDGDIPF